MHECDRFQDLPKEGLDSLDGKASVVIFFNELIKGGAERVEDQAEVTSMEERVLIPYDSFLVFFIASVDALQDLLLDSGGLNVFGNGFNNLRYQYSTLIAYRRPFFSA
jgi:hypothetical protein